MNYGEFELYPDRLAIDNVGYIWAPDALEFDQEEFGVRRESVPTSNLGRVVVTQTVDTNTVWHTNTDEDLFTNYRKAVNQAVRMEWSGEAFMTLTARDHLTTLYTLQRGYWLQFDDEMSYERVVLHAEDAEYKYYLTPTFPVAFSRASRGDNDEYLEEEHYIRVYRNGVLLEWEDNPWRFDPETGTLRFEISNDPEDEIAISYLWRMYVRTATQNITVSDGMPQNTYRGAVLFEQITPPNDAIPPRQPDDASDDEDDEDDDVEEGLPELEFVELPAQLREVHAKDFSAIGEYMTFLGDIPEDRYILGLEVVDVVGRVDHEGGTSTFTVALDDPDLPGSSLLQKNNQPSGYIDHATIGTTVSLGTVRLGSESYLWGRNFKDITPALVNDGIRFDFSINQSGPVVPGQHPLWSMGVQGSGNITRQTGTGPLVTAWHATNQSTWSLDNNQGTGGNLYFDVVSEGDVQITATYVGTIDPNPGSVPTKIITTQTNPFFEITTPVYYADEWNYSRNDGLGSTEVGTYLYDPVTQVITSKTTDGNTRDLQQVFGIPETGFKFAVKYSSVLDYHTSGSAVGIPAGTEVNVAVTLQPQPTSEIRSTPRLKVFYTRAKQSPPLLPDQAMVSTQASFMFGEMDGFDISDIPSTAYLVGAVWEFEARSDLAGVDTAEVSATVTGSMGTDISLNQDEGDILSQLTTSWKTFTLGEVDYLNMQGNDYVEMSDISELKISIRITDFSNSFNMLHVRNAKVKLYYVVP